MVILDRERQQSIELMLFSRLVSMNRYTAELCVEKLKHHIISSVENAKVSSWMYHDIEYDDNGNAMVFLSAEFGKVYDEKSKEILESKCYYCLSLVDGKVTPTSEVIRKVFIRSPDSYYLKPRSCETIKTTRNKNDFIRGFCNTRGFVDMLIDLHQKEH